jgi:acetyltransferase
MSAKRFAVVGASADSRKVGHQILSNLHSNKELTVYPINLKGGTILDLKVYGHLYETPEPPEVVIIAVPVLATEVVIDECIRIGTSAVVLISSGFAEAGDQGKVLQERIVSKLHAAGIALLGPNTMGYMAPGRGIYASFGPGGITAGSIAVISQSGAMLSALFGEYSSGSTGVSFAISLGNATGIDENDALSFVANDSATKDCHIFESLKDPKALLSIAKQISTKNQYFY